MIHVASQESPRDAESLREPPEEPQLGEYVADAAAESLACSRCGRQGAELQGSKPRGRGLSTEKTILSVMNGGENAVYAAIVRFSIASSNDSLSSSLSDSLVVASSSSSSESGSSS